VITGKKSPPYLPNVPTFAAAGYPSVNPEAFRFIIAPAGLPAPVLARLTKALAAIMSVPEFQTRLADNGFDPEFQTGNEARAFVTREIAKWRQAGRDAGLKLN
jgi:tripartite-type tricarboxylate transporter receptor subunit TctC